MANEHHPHVSTGLLQPAEVSSAILNNSTYDDPCCLHAIEAAEAAGADGGLGNSNAHEDSHATSGYGSLSMRQDTLAMKKRRSWKRLIISTYFALIIVEAIFGYLSGSVACLTATVHLLSDYLGEQPINRNRSVAFRRIECLIILSCVIILLAANSAFVVAAVGRLYVKNISINNTYMLIAAILALTANCIMLTMHFAKVFRPRRFLPLSDFIGVRIQQIAHAVGNHGTSVVLLIAATILLFVKHDAIIVDSIATFVLTLAILSNAASAITKYCIELKNIGKRQESYEAL